MSAARANSYAGSVSGLVAAVISSTVTRVRRVPLLIERKQAMRGLAYPWWIPLTSALCELSIVVIALAQRGALLPPRAAVGVLVLIVASHVVLFLTPVSIGWFADVALILGATVWLLLTPVHHAVPADTAPMLLMVLAAVVTARDGVVRGVVVTVIGIGLLFGIWHAADIRSPGLYSLEIVLGAAVGFMLLWQMRALTAERLARASEHERATSQERERIAREIHDLVAHSLSVTLLQVAGAREALLDGDQADAIAALDDAEAVGRQAMADIRSTVSSLRGGPGGLRPLPTAADVPALVEQFAAAGLDVSYAGVGDPSQVAGAAGLGVFRIAQEALANVAKHAPGAHTRVQLDVTATRARLAVTNTVAGLLTRSTTGAGLPGMAARAEGIGATLTAGPVTTGWSVELLLPIGSRCGLGVRLPGGGTR